MTFSESAAKEKTPFQSSLASIVMGTAEGDPIISGLAEEILRRKVSFVSGMPSGFVTRLISLSRSPGSKSKTPLGPKKSPVSAERKGTGNKNYLESKEGMRQVS